MAIGRGRERALAYLLRLWCVTDGQEASWHASLQDIRSGERLGFADLDGACRYLHARIEAAAGRAPSGDGPQDGAPPRGTQGT